VPEIWRQIGEMVADDLEALFAGREPQRMQQPIRNGGAPALAPDRLTGSDRSGRGLRPSAPPAIICRAVASGRLLGRRLLRGRLGGRLLRGRQSGAAATATVVSTILA
jgi:hypothetical protein